MIEHSYAGSHGIYGSPRVHQDIQAQGEVVGVNTIARLMKQHQIASKVHKRFVVTTNSRQTKAPSPNRLKQDFEADKPNQKWVSDVTFIATREGWLYLATVLELYSRRIIGWSMSSRHTSQLVIDAMEMALLQCEDAQGTYVHSDQGVQYASSDYQKLLAEHGLICSMSRKGNCWDNAAMESFYHSLKTEWVNFEDYKTRAEARASVFAYIELFYNRKRRHSSINYLSPVEFEREQGVY